MKNKIYLSLAFFSLLLVSCGSQKIDASFFIYNEDDTFVGSLMEKVQDDLKKDSRSYSISYASLSQTKQNEQLSDALNSGNSKVMAVNIVDRLSASSIIAKADSAKVPLIFFNRAPLEEDLASSSSAYYVGTDPTYEGMMQGDMAASLFGDANALNQEYDKNKDNVIQAVILKGEQGHQDTELRSRYCIKRLNDLGYKVETIASGYANWTRDQAYSVMKDIYAKYSSQIELVFSNNDDMAVGAINYLTDQNVFFKGQEKQVFPVIGVDATDIGVEYIQDGRLYGTIKNDASAQAQAIVDFVNYLSQGKPIDSSFPYEIPSNKMVTVKGIPVTKATL